MELTQKKLREIYDEIVSKLDEEEKENQEKDEHMLKHEGHKWRTLADIGERDGTYLGVGKMYQALKKAISEDNRAKTSNR